MSENAAEIEMLSAQQLEIVTVISVLLEHAVIEEIEVQNGVQNVQDWKEDQNAQLEIVARNVNMETVNQSVHVNGFQNVIATVTETIQTEWIVILSVSEETEAYQIVLIMTAKIVMEENVIVITQYAALGITAVKSTAVRCKREYS